MASAGRPGAVGGVTIRGGVMMQAMGEVMKLAIGGVTCGGRTEKAHGILSDCL
jgi:hypothetical protein